MPTSDQSKPEYFRLKVCILSRDSVLESLPEDSLLEPDAYLSLFTSFYILLPQLLAKRRNLVRPWFDVFDEFDRTDDPECDDCDLYLSAINLFSSYALLIVLLYC